MVLKPLKLALAASVLVFLAYPALSQEAAAPAASATTQTPAAAQPASTESTLPDAAAETAQAAEPEPTPTPTKASSPTPEVQCFSSLAEITILREPQFGAAPNVWDLLYAEDGMDVFSDVVQIDPQTMVVAGSYTKGKDDAVYHPLLVKYDERFKKVWEGREETKEQQTIYRVLKTKGGFTVLGDITDSKRGNGIYIASYDDAGKVKGKPVPIYEGGGDLDSKAFIPAQDGNGYIIAAQFVDSKDQENQYGLLYKVSTAGKIVWKRSFKPGLSTVFNNVQATLDGTYMVTGQIVIEGNKSGGWLVRVDDKGAIKWQRTYPRGMAASFQSAAQTKDGDFILVGKARPFGGAGKGLSAWVMKTDSTGTPLWSRFLKGEYSYEAPDVIVYEDGRSSVLLNAQSMDKDRRSHVRLATFSPLGQLLYLDEFTEGQNATAHRMISGLSGERIIAGFSQTSFGEDQEGHDNAPAYTYDGWLIAGVPLDIYEDPCGAAPAVSPILP